MFYCYFLKPCDVQYSSIGKQGAIERDKMKAGSVIKFVDRSIHKSSICSVIALSDVSQSMYR